MQDEAPTPQPETIPATKPRIPRNHTQQRKAMMVRKVDEIEFISRVWFGIVEPEQFENLGIGDFIPLQLQHLIVDGRYYQEVLIDFLSDDC